MDYLNLNRIQSVMSSNTAYQPTKKIATGLNHGSLMSKRLNKLQIVGESSRLSTARYFGYCYVKSAQATTFRLNNGWFENEYEVSQTNEDLSARRRYQGKGK